MEIKKKEPTTKKELARHGKVFAQRGGNIRDPKFRSVNVEEVNFQGEDIQTGLLGQIYAGQILSGGVAIGTYIQLETLGGVVLVSGNQAPSVNNTYNSGVSTNAWANVYAYAFPAPSDERIKDDIETLTYGMDTINNLRPVSFKYKDTDKTRLGLIAQETLQHIPEVVDTSDEEQLGINYQEIVPVLIKAVQELSDEVKELREKML